MCDHVVETVRACQCGVMCDHVVETVMVCQDAVMCDHVVETVMVCQCAVMCDHVVETVIVCQCSVRCDHVVETFRVLALMCPCVVDGMVKPRTVRVKCQHGMWLCAEPRDCLTEALHREVHRSGILFLH